MNIKAVAIKCSHSWEQKAAILRMRSCYQKTELEVVKPKRKVVYGAQEEVGKAEQQLKCMRIDK